MENELISREQFEEYEPISACPADERGELVPVRVYLRSEDRWFPVSLKLTLSVFSGRPVAGADISDLKTYQYQKVEGEDGVTRYVRSQFERIYYEPNVGQYADRIFSGVEINYRQVVIEYKQVGEISIPSPREAEILLKYMSYLPGFPRLLVSEGVTNRSYCIFSYLFPVFQMRGMLDAYGVYCRYPDKGVRLWNTPTMIEAMDRIHEITSRNGIPTVLENGVHTVPEGVMLSLTEQEWQALAYTVVFTWSKTKTNLANFRTALEKRLSTLQAVMHWRSFDVRAFMDSRLNPDELVSSGTYFDTFPRLKSTIVSQLLMDNSPLATHLCFILKESQLTIFNMMLVFVRDADMTCLHAQAEIVREVPGFIETFKQVKAKFGSNWPYLKLIDPLTQMTAQNKFPLLTEAARAWTLVSSPDIKTLKNIFGMNKVRTSYVKLAQVPIAMGEDTGEAMTVAQIRDAYGRIGRSKHIGDITKEVLDERIGQALRSDLRQDLKDFFENPRI
uniref:Nucleoprotein n=1 Tax=Guadeloupe mosquito mononega-like virus TaxID=2607732 RepID=A0A5C1K3A5_9MONO|nr:nucleoprotein [Guadeloupe mosquito mononega-like virus]